MTIIIYFNNINYCYYYSSIKNINEKNTIPYHIHICNSRTKNIRVHYKYKFTFTITARMTKYLLRFPLKNWMNKKKKKFEQALMFSICESESKMPICRLLDLEPLKHSIAERAIAKDTLGHRA